MSCKLNTTIQNPGLAQFRIFRPQNCCTLVTLSYSVVSHINFSRNCSVVISNCLLYVLFVYVFVGVQHVEQYVMSDVCVLLPVGSGR